MKNIVLLYALLFMVSCAQKKEKKDSSNTSDAGYFSIVQFAQDQFANFGGQPYTLRKIVTLNGKTDSTFVKANEMDWANVLKPFLESDISNKKYLDQYNFSLFEDSATDTRSFYYEAKEKKLFTRTLQITSDALNNKITAIYIETEKNGKVQKLFYRPLKIIQIQEYESPFWGKDKNLKVEYYFM